MEYMRKYTIKSKSMAVGSEVLDCKFHPSEYVCVVCTLCNREIGIR